MGAGRLDTIRRVVVPLVASGMVVTFLFIFILNWSEFLLALTLTHPKVTTLPVLLDKFQIRGPGSIVAKVDSEETVAVGDRRWFAFRDDRVVFFDGETGARTLRENS